MNVKVFLELVEIKTKIASIFPFFIGVALQAGLKLWHIAKITL